MPLTTPHQGDSPIEPRALRAALVLLLGVACLLTGAVTPLDRALLHGLLAAALLAASGATLPTAWARAWWRAWGVLALAVAVGMVPAPRALVEALAPGVAAARDGWAWMTLSLDPVATLETLAAIAALAGFGALVAAALPRSEGGAQRLEAGIAWAGLLWMAFGAAHAASGTELLLGWFPVRPLEGRFFAPLVNPNHAGLVAWLTVPFLVARARSTAPFPERLLCAAGVAWAAILPMVSASMGLLVVAAAQLGCAVAWAPWRRGTRGLLLGGGAIAAAGGAWTVWEQQPEWWALSGQPRLEQWADTWRLLADQPWTGVGAGAYAVGYPPYRSVPTFALFEHAHHDALEWVAETGIVGVVAGLAALALGPRVLPGAGRRPWAAALVGLVAHSCVDFPLHVPAVALLGVALLVGWTTLGAAEAPRRPVVQRTGLAVGAQVLCAALLLHHAAADRLATRALQADAEAAAQLQRLAPWRFEGPLGELLVGVPPGRLHIPEATVDLSLRAAAARAVAAGPERATALRLVTLRLLAAGDREAAAPLLERALVRDPNDWRTWYLEAQRRRAEGGAEEAATALAAAMGHWPHEGPGTGAALEEGYRWWPDGLWWVDRLADAPAHWSMRLAWLLQREGEAETALLAADQAALLRPSAHLFNPTKVEALLTLGLQRQATDYVATWVDRAPTNVWAQVSAARVAEPGSEVWWLAVARAAAVDPDLPATRRLLELSRRTAGRELPSAALVHQLIDAVAARDRNDRAACGQAALALSRATALSRWMAERRWSCERADVR